MDTDRIDRILYEINALQKECDNAKASFRLGAMKYETEEFLRILQDDTDANSDNQSESPEDNSGQEG